MWGDASMAKHHDFRYFFHEGVSNMFSHGFMSFAAIGITVACLLIMGTFTLVAVNANELLRTLEQENEILAYVDDSYTETQARALQSRLEAIPNVASATFISREEAMEDFKAQYPDEELFQDLFEYQPIGPDSRALEIGMGSGKASKPFLDRGCELIGLEPGAWLARCSLAKYGRTPRFRLEQTTLQDYVCPEGVFDLVYAATAFHWIPEEYGYRRVHALLRPGGAFARFAYHAGPDHSRPALVEEFLYRGVILRALMRFGTGFAILTSSLLFALMHGNLSQIIFAFPLGLLFAILVVRTGNLWITIVVHFLNNFLSSLYLIVSATAGTQAAELYSTIFPPVLWVLGAVGLAYLLIHSRGTFFRLSPPRTLLPNSMKASGFFGNPGVILFLCYTAFSCVLYLIPS